MHKYLIIALSASSLLVACEQSSTTSTTYSEPAEPSITQPRTSKAEVNAQDQSVPARQVNREQLPYVILRSTSTVELEKLVQEAFLNGYVLQGGVSATPINALNHYYVQAVVLHSVVK